MTEKIDKTLFNEAVVKFFIENYDAIVDAFYNEVQEAIVYKYDKRKERYETLLNRAHKMYNIAVEELGY